MRTAPRPDPPLPRRHRPRGLGPGQPHGADPAGAAEPTGSPGPPRRPPEPGGTGRGRKQPPNAKGHERNPGAPQTQRPTCRPRPAALPTDPARLAVFGAARTRGRHGNLAPARPGRGSCASTSGTTRRRHGTGLRTSACSYADAVLAGAWTALWTSRTAPGCGGRPRAPARARRRGRTPPWGRGADGQGLAGPSNAAPRRRPGAPRSSGRGTRASSRTSGGG
ncbi:hypothetical protein QJS66_02030 [Kocuria rhizophila]|nr:hypothetical protein QJS66_02030 [Kocuria rhizophila]